MPLYVFKNKAENIEIPIFFIHIAKCGGTTIKGFFEHLKMDSFLAPKEYYEVKKYLKLPPAHYGITLLESLFLLDKIYTFTLVRNPYERMLSDYKWAKTKNFYNKKFQNMSFEEFCTDCIKQYSIDNNYLDNHITPQHMFISPNVNKVFKFEDGLETAIQQVFLDVGLQLSEKLFLPKLNASGVESLFFSQKAKDLIYEFYAEDFKTFGYQR